MPLFQKKPNNSPAPPCPQCLSLARQLPLEMPEVNFSALAQHEADIIKLTESIFVHATYHALATGQVYDFQDMQAAYRLSTLVQKLFKDFKDNPKPL